MGVYQKNRKPQVVGSVAYIPLTLGYVAKVDVDDLPIVGQFLWTAKEHKRADGSVREVYAYRKERGEQYKVNVFLHRAICGTESSVVDHIDGDGLNNTRANLRPATHSENQFNRVPAYRSRSGYKGVHLNKRGGKWMAEINANHQKVRLGSFDTPEDAAAAYAETAELLHGKFARAA